MAEEVLVQPQLQGTLRTEAGTVPAVWIELPGHLAEVRGQFEVEHRPGDSADIFGVRFPGEETVWIALPTSTAEAARKAGKLAVFTEPAERAGQPYFTIDFYGP
jgi:hypothetical protein